jgi:HSP20 family molecular chaperone IbpA
MTLASQEPLKALERLHQSMQGLVADVLEHCNQSTIWVGNIQTAGISAIELQETDTELILLVQIPDLDEPLDVQVTQETVLIQGRLMQHGVAGYFCPERFQSIIPLPSPVQPDTVQADLQDDTLTLRLTKLHAVRQPKIRLKLTSRNACMLATLAS